jgi:hypothetical protein
MKEAVRTLTNKQGPFFYDAMKNHDMTNLFQVISFHGMLMKIR